MSCPFHYKNSPSFWKKIKSLFKRFVQINSPTDMLGILSSQNLAAILDNTVDSILTTNEHGEILAFNKAAEKTFGYEKGEVLGKNVNLLMPEPFRSQHDTYMQNYLKTGVKKIIGIGREALAKRKNGSIFPVALSVSEVFTENGHLFTGIIRDLTEEKKAQELAESNAFLEGQLIAKNEYISILSHELRTPLAGIYGSLSLLSKDKTFSEKHHEFIEIAFRNAERLMHIINDVLDITKIQSGKIQLVSVPVSIFKLVQESVTAAKLLADHLEIDLTYSLPPLDIFVMADQLRLTQVMLNFLSNAMKFSPPHSKVIVKAEPVKDIVRVSVQDFGLGIPSSFHKNIFTPFSQVTPNKARILGGSGLGLHICKIFIEQFKGTVGFTSKENEGSIFFFELPIYKEKA